MALIATENWPRGKIASGQDWARGVEYLRELGFPIPLWTPDATSVDPQGNEYDKMPYWALRKAAVALDVVDEDAFVEKDGQYGTYLAFPDRESFDRTLRAVEAAGLEHNREYLTDEHAPSESDDLDSGTESS